MREFLTPTSHKSAERAIPELVNSIARLRYQKSRFFPFVSSHWTKITAEVLAVNCINIQRQKNAASILSLLFLSEDTVSQKLLDLIRRQFPPNVPTSTAQVANCRKPLPPAMYLQRPLLRKLNIYAL